MRVCSRRLQSERPVFYLWADRNEVFLFVLVKPVYSVLRGSDEMWVAGLDT